MVGGALPTCSTLRVIINLRSCGRRQKRRLTRNNKVAIVCLFLVEVQLPGRHMGVGTGYVSGADLPILAVFLDCFLFSHFV